MSHSNSDEPHKRIYGESDIVHFQRSLASKKLHHVMSFIIDRVTALEVPEGQLRSNLVANGVSLSPDRLANTTVDHSNACRSRKNIASLLGILDALQLLVDETPPLQGPRRFGNMACRDWHVKLKSRSSSMIRRFCKDETGFAELNHYFLNSFGSEVRLDYGTGHELSFIAFVGGLFDLGVLETSTSGESLLAVFCKYYDLVRRLILDYSLEPAGSHGVWGLDDHFHFIYILGAAQFNRKSKQHENGSRYVPSVSQVLTPQTLETYKDSNLYVNAIAFIFRLKSGPFHEHSPVLYDIHKSVTLWSKVQSGLLKMYEAEVLGKYPVVQHFWFGNKLYPWVDIITSKSLPVRPTDDSTTQPSEQSEYLPGLINGLQGMKTTTSNISMTGAPWANTKALRGQSARGNGRVMKGKGVGIQEYTQSKDGT